MHIGRVYLWCLFNIFRVGRQSVFLPNISVSSCLLADLKQVGFVGELCPVDV